jgi:hypothetical protein
MVVKQLNPAEGSGAGNSAGLNSGAAGSRGLVRLKGQ